MRYQGDEDVADDEVVTAVTQEPEVALGRAGALLAEVGEA